jgi:hypothetical protein
MSELATTKRNIEVPPARAIAGLIAVGAIAVALFVLGTMARPGSVLAPATTTVLQAPSRDDFAFRYERAVSDSDDYALRGTAFAPAVPVTGGQDDYGVRHPLLAVVTTDKTDFALRHQTWAISAQAPSRDDYGLR